MFSQAKALHLVEETNNLTRDVLSPRLLVVHDAGGGGQDDVAELTGRQELDHPLLHVAQLDVVAGADDAGLVQAAVESVLRSQRVSVYNIPAVELDDDLAVAVVIDLFEFANVAC